MVYGTMQVYIDASVCTAPSMSCGSVGIDSWYCAAVRGSIPQSEHFYVRHSTPYNEYYCGDPGWTFSPWPQNVPYQSLLCPTMTRRIACASLTPPAAPTFWSLKVPALQIYMLLYASVSFDPYPYLLAILDTLDPWMLGRVPHHSAHNLQQLSYLKAVVNQTP